MVRFGGKKVLVGDSVPLKGNSWEFVFCKDVHTYLYFYKWENALDCETFWGSKETWGRFGGSCCKFSSERKGFLFQAAGRPPFTRWRLRGALERFSESGQAWLGVEGFVCLDCCPQKLLLNLQYDLLGWVRPGVEAAMLVLFYASPRNLHPPPSKSWTNKRDLGISLSFG